jgi:predicted ATP-dependent protease
MIITQAHLEIIDFVAKQKGSTAVAREMFKQRGLKDFSKPTIYNYLRLARERWQSIEPDDDKEEDLVEKNSENVDRELAGSSSAGSVDDVYKLATEACKRRKKILFSNGHRDFLLEFINELGYTVKDREVLFHTVSQEFLKKGLKKVSRKTFMKHLKRNVSDLLLKNHDQPIMAEDEEEVAGAVSGLLFLRKGEA